MSCYFCPWDADIQLSFYLFEDWPDGFLLCDFLILAAFDEYLKNGMSKTKYADSGVMVFSLIKGIFHNYLFKEDSPIVVVFGKAI